MLLDRSLAKSRRCFAVHAHAPEYQASSSGTMWATSTSAGSTKTVTSHTDTHCGWSTVQGEPRVCSLAPVDYYPFAGGAPVGPDYRVFEGGLIEFGTCRRLPDQGIQQRLAGGLAFERVPVRQGHALTAGRNRELPGGLEAPLPQSARRLAATTWCSASQLASSQCPTLCTSWLCPDPTPPQQAATDRNYGCMARIPRNFHGRQSRPSADFPRAVVSAWKWAYAVRTAPVRGTVPGPAGEGARRARGCPCPGHRGTGKDNDEVFV